MISQILLQDIMLFTAGIALFAIIFVTVHRTLCSMPLIQSKITTTIMALSVSVLCLVGIYECLTASSVAHKSIEPENKTNTTLNYILLPYVALAIAIIFSQLLLFTSRILPYEKSETDAKERRSPVQKPMRAASKVKSPKRLKKKKPVKKKLKEADKLVGNTS